MDKETLSHYGWIVILVLILSVLLAFASPFGTFIADGFKAAYTGLFDVENSAMDVVMNATGGCTHRETEVTNVTADYSGDTVCKKCGLLMGTGKYLVPEGGTYTAADGTVYNPGDGFPENVTTGDSYSYGNYEYRYNQYHAANWKLNEAQNGWGVRCRNSVANPGPILESINGKPITSMYSTFANHTSLTTAPAIPDTVTNLYNAFGGCYNLKTYIGSTDPDGDFSGYVIPSNVTTMYFTFTNCKSLTTTPDLSNATSVKSMDSTFDGCTSLVNIDNLVIPESTTSMQYMLKGCTALIDASKLVISENVENVCGVFQNCTNLKSAPIMPRKAYKMYWLFDNCTSLTGTIIFNTKFEANIWAKDSMSGVDFEAQNLTLAGTSTYLDGIGATGINYCTTCNGRHMRADEEHTCHGGTATCTDLAVCVSCNNEYGNLTNHNNVHNGVCATCGQTGLAIESDHSPYLNSQSNVVLGTWDYSDAESVTITITYQTESTSYDWICLKSGDNYIDLDGNITSTETKIGGSTKTTKTFTTTATSGSVIFRTDGSGNNYYGVSVQVTPNY